MLRGRTRGYRHHPQLERFRAHSTPRSSINAYLHAVHQESLARCYRFDRGKVGRFSETGAIVTTDGQLEYEWRHLLAKLRARSPEDYRRLKLVARPDAHPLFRIVAGPVAPWEVSSSGTTRQRTPRPPARSPS